MFLYGPLRSQFLPQPEQLWILFRNPGIVLLLQVLECRVCEDVFTLQGDKVPRLLYCGHTVCHSCLLRISTSDDVICCPFDRQPTPIGSKVCISRVFCRLFNLLYYLCIGTSGVWGLKKNFALLELLERLQLCYEKEAASFLRNTEILDKEKSVSFQICFMNSRAQAILQYCSIKTNDLRFQNIPLHS